MDGKRRKFCIGARFGRLTIIGLEKLKAKCLCDCGTEKTVHRSNLSSGSTTSCGCYMREFVSVNSKKHGKRKTRTYNIWSNMRQRCHNENHPAFNRYGGRGIFVCERWRSSFEAFVEDMGDCPEGLEIDRKNNNLGYFKENCRWATRAAKNQNTSVSKRWIIDGEEYPSCAAAAKALGKGRNTIASMVNENEGCSSELKY